MMEIHLYYHFPSLAPLSAERPRFAVVLVELRGDKVQVVKLVQKYLDTTIEEAKDLVEKIPVVVFETTARWMATQVQAEFEKRGGKTEILVVPAKVMKV